MKQITKLELEKLYQENTNKEVAEILGISIITLNKYIKEAGIKLKGKGNRKSKLQIIK